MLLVRLSLETHQGQERKEARGKTTFEAIGQGEQCRHHYYERKQEK